MLSINGYSESNEAKTQRIRVLIRTGTFHSISSENKKENIYLVVNYGAQRFITAPCKNVFYSAIFKEEFYLTFDSSVKELLVECWRFEPEELSNSFKGKGSLDLSNLKNKKSVEWVKIETNSKKHTADIIFEIQMEGEPIQSIKSRIYTYATSPSENHFKGRENQENIHRLQIEGDLQKIKNLTKGAFETENGKLRFSKDPANSRVLEEIRMNY